MRQFVFFLCCAILTLSGIDSSSGRSTQGGARVAGRCLTDDQLAQSLVSLAGAYDEARRAQHLLRQAAKRSSTCRQQIVAAVMTAMDKPGLDIRRNQADADLWQEGAVLLGDLKATQSLDLLLSHITMTDGEWSSTMRHQPALAGIVGMGSLAIPKLKRLLRKGDSQTRYYVVYCLYQIGGGAARRILQQALPKESDRCVRRFIVVSLKEMRGIKPDPGEWASAIICSS